MGMQPSCSTHLVRFDRHAVYTVAPHRGISAVHMRMVANSPGFGGKGVALHHNGTLNMQLMYRGMLARARVCECVHAESRG